LASIDIFIGDPITHASERATLERAVDFLSAQGTSAVILANLNLGGRQVDLVIGLEQGALVVEAKGFSAAVRGNENGDWHLRITSHRWKEIPNAYAQALAEKLVLRDAMAEFAGTKVPYPDAALIFVPAIAAGSTIPRGDFKVSIGGLDELPKQIVSVKRRSWSLDQWRAFAAHHRLIAVPSIDAALSIELLDAERLLAAYGESFKRTYGPPASRMVPMPCIYNGGTVSSANLLEQPAQDDNILLTGDSGCGKSLLSYTISVAALGHGRVPIVIPAKDFEGNLRDVANREAALLDARSAAAVISAARLLDRRLVLVVDGYNECKPSERQRLTRSIAAIVKRYGATAVVSSRIPLERDDLLTASIYAVQVPDNRVKRTIAQQAAGGASVEAFSELLDSVRSGLEAVLIGKLGQQLPVGTSKYGLFDTYVRQRLGPAASDGIRALSRVAAMMTERISFSLSVRELDRLSDREGVSGVVVQTLLGANILDKRGERVSFTHEMFLNVFAAEAIIRRAGDDPDSVIAALRLPQHLEMKPFALGAIDDDIFRRRVLFGLSDARVIRACLTGQCGSDALLWANQRCDDVLAQIREEVDTVRFDVSEKFPWRVRAKPETIQQWTVQDRAVLAAIPHELVAGRRLDEVLYLIGKMDDRLAIEHRRLLSEVREKKAGIRSGLYAVSYSGVGGGEVGLSQICSPIHSGLLYDGPKVAASANLHGRLHCETLSPGQVGLLVELDRYSDRDAPSLGTVLPRLLNRLWSQAPHHLRLGLMHAASMSARSLSDKERHTLIDAIIALLPANGGFDSAGMVDALKFLGALDDSESEYVSSSKVEIESALADRDNPLMWDAAAHLWIAQFDHPYDGAYCQAWNDLTADNRKALLLMAARSAEGSSMFTPALIAEVAALADPAACPILARFTALPSKQDVIMGDAIRSFRMAHAALAYLRCPPHDHLVETESTADQALLACGKILYWINRSDLSQEERGQNCASPLAILSRHELGVAAAVVGEFIQTDYTLEEAIKSAMNSESITVSFGIGLRNEISEICRAALERPTLQSGYFDFFRVEEVIEGHSHIWAASAVRAIFR